MVARFPVPAVLLVLATLLAAPRPAGAAEAAAAHGGPILALEDSLPVYMLPETTRVVARRIPVAELIRKAQEGERRKYDGVQTLAFNRIVKVTLVHAGRKPRTRCIESVARVYYRRPDQWAEAPLRETKYVLGPAGTHLPWDEPEKNDQAEPRAEDGGGGDGISIRIGRGGDTRVDVSAGDGDETGRQLSRLPVYLQEVDKFDFRIVHRSLQKDEVLYEIEFEPRSDFDVLPGGRLWLLTNGYRIVREEYHVRNLPVPWLLKSLGLLTVEWQEVQGRWVPHRITARAELRTGVGLGLIDVPRTVELVMLLDGVRIDPPLDPALFEPEAKP
jgi:hypothetical protein